MSISFEFAKVQKNGIRISAARGVFFSPQHLSHLSAMRAKFFRNNRVIL
jgi:hypothetical protein